LIKSIEIEGFRSLRHVQLVLRPFNVLIGPNQSGKTNILDALDFLAHAMRGQLKTSLYHSRGGLTNLLWGGKGARHIRYRIEFKPAGQYSAEGELVAYGFTIEQQSQGHVIAEEYAEVGPKPGHTRPLQLLRMKRGSGFLHNLLSRKNEDFTLESHEHQELAIAQIRDPRAYPTLGKIRAELSSILIYPGFDAKARWAADDPKDAPQIRQPQFVENAAVVSPLGENLVNVLYTLSQDEDPWEEFKEKVRIGFPDFENLTFPPDAGQGRIALAWIDRRFPKRKFPAEVLSAGTLCFLAWAAVLVSPGSPNLIGIEEPEVHLHPELLYRLVGMMEQTATAHQLVVTTHSDLLLSYLSEPTDVILVQNGQEGTTLTRPPEEDLHEWLKSYSLGQLREAGHLAAFAAMER
jgi:predicted ATPase